ncbi:hypothetical protein GGX14DRAFT_409191 [Mycena pura]|uniref:Uncharacterized protein n=1 Tax=Mycena pura TaxID=153505 RepID=A0AAD6XVA8_9AGAR|nr:hypothetical protein GGX14DRAFT_409191 [Mycena pura]
MRECIAEMRQSFGHMHQNKAEKSRKASEGRRVERGCAAKLHERTEMKRSEAPKFNDQYRSNRLKAIGCERALGSKGFGQLHQRADGTAHKCARTERAGRKQTQGSEDRGWLHRARMSSWGAVGVPRSKHGDAGRGSDEVSECRRCIGETARRCGQDLWASRDWVQAQCNRTKALAKASALRLAWGLVAPHLGVDRSTDAPEHKGRSEVQDDKTPRRSNDADGPGRGVNDHQLRVAPSPEVLNSDGGREVKPGKPGSANARPKRVGGPPGGRTSAKTSEPERTPKLKPKTAAEQPAELLSPFKVDVPSSTEMEHPDMKRSAGTEVSRAAAERRGKPDRNRGGNVGPSRRKAERRDEVKRKADGARRNRAKQDRCLKWTGSNRVAFPQGQRLTLKAHGRAKFGGPTANRAVIDKIDRRRPSAPRNVVEMTGRPHGRKLAEKSFLTTPKNTEEQKRASEGPKASINGPEASGEGCGASIKDQNRPVKDDGCPRGTRIQLMTFANDRRDRLEYRDDRKKRVRTQNTDRHTDRNVAGTRYPGTGTDGESDRERLIHVKHGTSRGWIRNRKRSCGPKRQQN